MKCYFSTCEILILYHECIINKIKFYNSYRFFFCLLRLAMADFFDDFAPVESAPAPTGAETVSDPAADFLAAEQSDLAQIEQNVYDEVPQTQGSFFNV